MFVQLQGPIILDWYFLPGRLFKRASPTSWRDVCFFAFRQGSNAEGILVRTGDLPVLLWDALGGTSENGHPIAMNPCGYSYWLLLFHSQVMNLSMKVHAFVSYINPIPSMGLEYLPKFGWFYGKISGKCRCKCRQIYTNPMDGMGIFLEGILTHGYWANVSRSTPWCIPNSGVISEMGWTMSLWFTLVHFCVDRMLGFLWG